HYQLRRTGRTQQSSAHTYRLLVFKEHIAGQSLPHHRLASLHQQQRNEIMNNPPVRVNKNFKLSFLANRAQNLLLPAPSTPPIPPTPASFAFIESRRNGILVSESRLRKEDAKK
ncbi:hypothetical protein, partial [Caballeronia sp. INDeC2]|uniref:hypothetical protein n=1 Tax=Caballeronia sp. INDeC2 TaxID=2921747 RepID=UPI0020280153